MIIKISDEHKLILAAIGVFVLLTILVLIFGAVFDFCDRRKIGKQESNIAIRQNRVEESGKKVNESKQNAAEKRGEIKILKEVKKENDEEVNQKLRERRKAADNRADVRRNPVRNVNGADLERILDEAERGKP